MKLTDDERRAVASHVAKVIAYAERLQIERRRLFKSRESELDALGLDTSQDLWSGVLYMKRDSDAHSPIFHIRNEIDRGVAAYQSTIGPCPTPELTPAAAIAEIEMAEHVDSLLSNHFPPADSLPMRAEKMQNFYVLLRRRLLDYVVIAPSITEDLAHQPDPAIGLQNIVAWCKAVSAKHFLDRKEIADMLQISYSQASKLAASDLFGQETGGKFLASRVGSYRPQPQKRRQQGAKAKGRRRAQQFAKRLKDLE